MSDNEVERTPLSNKEYYAIRLMFGIVSAFQTGMETIEKRAKKVPGVWRDMKMITTKGQNVITDILKTVPTEKLMIIYKELNNMRASVDIVQRGLPEPEHDAFTYVPTEALDALIRGVVEWECAFCEKDRKAARSCRWRKAIEDTYPYDLPETSRDHCRFSGFLIEERKDTE